MREVERRIQKAEAQSDDGALPDVDRPVGVPAAYADHARLMFDLQVLALQADVTRVITFQLARESSNRTYPRDRRAGSASPDVPPRQRPREGGEAGEDQRVPRLPLFAYFLEKLAAVPEGDGNLLDNSLYLYGSGMGNPNVHDHVNLPIVVAGAEEAPSAADSTSSTTSRRRWPTST